MEKKGELQPPEPYDACPSAAPGLDEGEVERDREREQQNPWIGPEEQKDEHAHLVSDTAAVSARWTVASPGDNRPLMTVKDVILTVTLMLGAGLCARLVADILACRTCWCCWGLGFS